MALEGMFSSDGIRLFLFLLLLVGGAIFAYKNFKKATSKSVQTNREISDCEKIKKEKEQGHFIAVRNTVIWLAMLPVSAYICFFAFRLPLSESPEHWGQMGDFLGGMLNPILAFASFLALLYTIKIQSDELTLTRNELKASSEALSGQLLVQEQQKFETTFFNLINHLDIQVKITLSHPQFRTDFNRVIIPREQINEGRHSRPGNYCTFQGADRWDDAYQSILMFHQPLDKISAITYVVLSLIQSQNFFDNTKLRGELTRAGKKPLVSEEFYLTILKSQIDDDLMKLLVVWCHGKEVNKLKMLAEQYSLFDSVKFMKFPKDGNQANPIDDTTNNLIGWGLPLDRSNLRLSAFAKDE